MGETFVFAIVYLVMACVSKQYTENATIGAAPICGIVFSVMLAAITIVTCILVRERRAQQPNYAYEPVGHGAPVEYAPVPENASQTYETAATESVATVDEVSETAEQAETSKESETVEQSKLEKE